MGKTMEYATPSGVCRPVSPTGSRPLESLAGEEGMPPSLPQLYHCSPLRLHSLNATYVLSGLHMGTLKSPLQSEGFFEGKNITVHAFGIRRDPSSNTSLTTLLLNDLG